MPIGAAGQPFFTERGKTGVPVGGVLSARSVAALAAYLTQLGTELVGDAYIFRNRSGQPYPKTRSAMISASSETLSSARSKPAPSGTISGAVVQLKLLSATRFRLLLRTPWVIPCRHQTHCSPPTCR